MKVTYYLKFFFGSPYLYSYNILHCFTDDFLRTLPAKDDRVVQFTDYIFDKYITPDAMFPQVFGYSFLLAVAVLLTTVKVFIHT
jgi:hypothetical protein